MTPIDTVYYSFFPSITQGQCRVHWTEGAGDNKETYNSVDVLTNQKICFLQPNPGKELKGLIFTSRSTYIDCTGTQNIVRHEV